MSGADQEPSFKHTKFEMSTRQPSGDVKMAAGCRSRDFQEVCGTADSLPGS